MLESFIATSIELFQNSQLAVVLTVQTDGATENVVSPDGSHYAVTVHNLQLSILEKLIVMQL